MIRFGLAVMVAAVAIGVATDVVTQTEPSSAMKPFVFIFRQRSAQLSADDLKRRADEVRVWAQAQNSEGRKLDPRILDDESYTIGPNGEEVPAGSTDDGRLSAILFVEARDMADAVAVAKSHPGLRYGVVTVEVRPWAPPVVPPSSPR